MLVTDLHKHHGHCGREFTLSLVLRRFWILGARRLIKSIIHKCLPCRRLTEKPCQPAMASLPADRVTPTQAAFSNTGVDFFGPFYIKRGRGREKRYGCLFTCLVSRAIHLEVAHGLDTSSFIASRGKPDTIRSDNGTNFCQCSSMKR